MSRDFSESIRARMNEGDIDISDRVAFDTQAEDALGTTLVNTSTLTNRGFEKIGTNTDASREEFYRSKLRDYGIEP